MSIILNNVLRILDNIDVLGCSINNTREMINQSAIIYMEDFNFKKEEKEIKTFYNKFVGDYNKRIELEADHYNFLKAFIIHKVKENIYFFKLKSDDYTSRKNVIWSNDCVSSIQFLHRPYMNILNVFIRSSDAINLLPADLLYMTDLLNQVLDRYKIKKTVCDSVYFYITSCHIYDKDKKKLNGILNQYENSISQ